MDFQTEKRFVRDYYAALDAAEGDAIDAVMDRYIAAQYTWRGYHPFHEQASSKAVAEPAQDCYSESFDCQAWAHIILGIGNR